MSAPLPAPLAVSALPPRPGPVTRSNETTSSCGRGRSLSTVPLPMRPVCNLTGNRIKVFAVKRPSLLPALLGMIPPSCGWREKGKISDKILTFFFSRDSLDNTCRHLSHVGRGSVTQCSSLTGSGQGQGSCEAQRDTPFHSTVTYQKCHTRTRALRPSRLRETWRLRKCL